MADQKGWRVVSSGARLVDSHLQPLHIAELAATLLLAASTGALAQTSSNSEFLRIGDQQEETTCFPVHTLQIEPATGLPQGWGIAMHKSLNWDGEDRCLDVQGISSLQERAQALLIEQGYVTSRVLIPQQNLLSGVIKLYIVPGRIHAVRLSEGANLSTEALSRASPTKPGEVLNLRDLEQTLENLQRPPTSKADIRIEPGTEPATSDWVVQYQQGFPLRGTLSLDDGGTSSTGKYLGSATLSWDNALGLNDLFYFTRNTDLGQLLGGKDPGGRGTHGQSVHYSLPFGYWSTGWTWSANRYHQSVAGQSQTYTYSGDSELHELFINRIVHRSAQSKTTASLKAFSRSSRNFVDDTEVQIQRRSVGGWALGLAHKQFVENNTLDTSIQLKRGTKDFAAIDAPEEATGQGTARFTLWQMDLAWSQALRWGSQSVRWNSNLRLQGNESPLTPQDRFSIGGRYTVRGFDGTNSLSAERGALWRNELSLKLGDTGQEMYLALDQGVVDGPSSEELVGKRLAGVAIGWRGAWKAFQYDAFIGYVVDKPSNFRAGDSAAGCSLSLTF